MSDSISLLVDQLQYLFSNITLINIIDILLVAILFFILFQALYQTRTLQLLRGVLIIAIVGLSVFFLLPLQTFNYIVLGLLIAGAIALPILFQDELRRALTGLGQIGFRRSNGSSYDQFINDLVNACEQLVASRHGALFVLESHTPLDDIIETGIPTNAEKISTELLTTIFFPNTPLHDGAVVLRGDRLMAAACILPVQKEQTEVEHLGTRHRAALGLSNQVPDALIIVISEETGTIAIAQNGKLKRGVKPDDLRQQLDRFQQRTASRPRIQWKWLRSGGIKFVISNVIIALALAVLAWVSIMFQVNPVESITVGDVPVSIIPPGPELILTSKIPESIRVTVQTTKDRADRQDPSTINAEVDLSGLSSGAHQIPFEVTLTDPAVQIIDINPSFVNVVLESKISREFNPNVNLTGLIPTGYRLVETRVTPGSVIVEGQESLVSQVVQANVNISLTDKKESFQEVLSVELLDQEGNILQGLTSSPAQILVEVIIEQSFATRAVAVKANIDTTTLDPDFEITSVTLIPSIVTLKGNPTKLAEVGNFIETAPIDLTGVFSEFSTTVPLILPEGVTAINQDNEEILNVRAEITVEPIPNFLTVTRFIQVTGLDPSLQVRIPSTRVDVLLFGSAEVLQEIESTPGLVKVFINLAGYSTGTHTVPIEYNAPQDVVVELFPSDVEVVITDRP